MMDNEKTLLCDSKVGDRVVLLESPDRYPNRYSFATIEKRNEKSIVVNGKRFYRRKIGSYVYDDWVAQKEAYSSTSYEILPNTKENQLKVKNTEAQDAQRKINTENARLEKESDEAEMKAFLATDEGKVFTALKEDWVGTEIAVIPRYVTENGRQTNVYIFEPNANTLRNSHDHIWKTKVAEIEITQSTSWFSNYEAEPKISFRFLKNAEIRGQSQFENPKRAERYLEAFKKAIEIAKLWDADSGRKWDGDALVAVDAPCEITEKNSW